jgi:hypothetical protein
MRVNRDMKRWMGIFGGACVAAPLLAVILLGASKSNPPMKPADVGITDDQMKEIGMLHAAVVDALDDLSPTTTRRVFRQQPDGSYKVERIEASFGATRIPPMSIQHGELVRELPWGRFSNSPTVLYCLVSCDGAPLNRDALKLKVTGAGSFPEPKMEDATVIEAARDAFPAVTSGLDYGVRLPGRSLWMKPLKLTQAACLGCHANMKVGSIVGIAVYATPTKAEDSPAKKPAGASPVQYFGSQR